MTFVVGFIAMAFYILWCYLDVNSRKPEIYEYANYCVIKSRERFMNENGNWEDRLSHAKKFYSVDKAKEFYKTVKINKDKYPNIHKLER